MDNLKNLADGKHKNKESLIHIDIDEYSMLCELINKHPKHSGREILIGDWLISCNSNGVILVWDKYESEIMFSATEKGYTGFVEPYTLTQVLREEDKRNIPDVIFNRARLLLKFVTTHLKHTPEASEEVLRFIGNFTFHEVPEQNLNDSYEAIRSTFRAGYCYYFAVMLQTAFKRGTIAQAYPFAHIVWVDYDGIPYDIEGVYCGEAEKYIQVEELGDSLEGFKHVTKIL